MFHREPELPDDTQEGVQDCTQVGTQENTASIIPSNFPLKKHLHDHSEAVLSELSQDKLSLSSQVAMSDSSKERSHLIKKKKENLN